MFQKYIIFALSLTMLSANAQNQLKIYHGSNGESQIYNTTDRVVHKPKIKMRQGELLTITVINANPLLYNYILKYENVAIESEDKAITDLLSTFNSIIAARMGSAAFAAKTTETNEYKSAINDLTKDINDAKKYILQSDKPETPDEALKFSRNAGLRKALDIINSMSDAQFRFNNTNLLNDLNILSEKAGLDDVEKQAFKLLNSSIVEKVNEIKKKCSLQTTQTVWKNEFKVMDSTTKITLLVNRIDKNNNTLIRDGNGEKEFQLEVGTVIPFYQRAIFELVPVANFIFSKDVREFYLENDIVQSRLKPKTTTVAGFVLNMNIANFGERKEMSVGIGPGYKISSAGDAFENLYLSTLFSYKNFFRIGVGFGFAQYPAEELKGGGKTGQPLPSNVSNLNDLLEFQEKTSVFLTMSFTGLNLSKKK